MLFVGTVRHGRDSMQQALRQLVTTPTASKQTLVAAEQQLPGSILFHLGPTFIADLLFRLIRSESTLIGTPRGVFHGNSTSRQVDSEHELKFV